MASVDWAITCALLTYGLNTWSTHHRPPASTVLLASLRPSLHFGLRSTARAFAWGFAA
jgi:hypothetical protein